MKEPLLQIIGTSKFRASSTPSLILMTTSHTASPQGGVTISIKKNTVATVHCSPRNPPWIRKPLLQGPLAGKRQNVFALEHLQLLVPGNGPYLKKLLIRSSKDVRGSKDMSFRVFQSVGFPWVPLKTRNGACWPFSLLGSA